MGYWIFDKLDFPCRLVHRHNTLLSSMSLRNSFNHKISFTAVEAASVVKFDTEDCLRVH